MSLSITQPKPFEGHFQFWHGAQKWQSPIEIQPVRPGRYECGPGLYLTNRLDRAKRYARGAGCLVEIKLDASTRWLHDQTMELSELIHMVKSFPRLKAKSSIIEDLKYAVERHSSTCLPLAYLVNLCVNHEALSGQAGPRLAHWLSEHGAQASHERHGSESWVVVFAPNIVVSQKVHRVALVDHEADFPSWEEQIKRIQAYQNVHLEDESSHIPSKCVVSSPRSR